MSNRVLAFLILAWFGGAIYGFYLYFYVYYKWNLNVGANIENYEITLYSDTVKRTFTQSCENSACLFVWLPPVDYSLTATASGYIDIKQKLKIPKNDLENIELSFEKKITLKKLENNFTPSLTAKEKIEAFNTKKLYKLIDNTAGIFFITKDKNTITLSDENVSIWEFDFFGTKRDIVITPVLWSSENVWIKIWNKHFLYHKIYKQLSLLSLEDIIYIKSEGWYDVDIITPDMLYSYTPNINKLSPQEHQQDHVVLNNTSIYLDNTGSQSIIKTDERVLLESNIKLTTIYLQDTKVYFTDTQNNVYVLTWFE